MNILIKINRLIKYSFYLLFIITPLLMYHKTSEIFEFNKMLFIYFMTVSIFGLWLVKMILFKKIIFKKTFLDIPIFLFFFSQILSTFFSIDTHTSLFGYYGRFNGGLLSILSYITLYYAFVSNFSDSFNTKNEIKTFIKISIATSVLVVFWGLPSKLGYDLTCYLFTGILNNNCWTEQFKPAERMFSTLGQPNWLSAYLIINFFLSLYFILEKEKKTFFNSTLNYFVTLIIFIGILFTRSRSGYIALATGLFLFFFFIAIKNKIWKFNFRITKKFFFLLFFFLCFVFLFKTGIPQIDQFLEPYILIKKLLSKSKYFNKTNNIFTPNTSTPSSGITDSGEIRKIVWKGAIDLGLKYPYFGTGVETFAYSYYFVRPKEHNMTSEWDYVYNKAHNEFLNYLATTGFFGFSAYLIMIFTVIFLLFKKIYDFQSLNRPETKNASFNTLNNFSNFSYNNQLLIFCFFLAYLSILITNFFGFSTTTINLYFYLIPAFIITNYDFIKKEDGKLSINLLNVSLLQKIFFLPILFFYLLVTNYLISYHSADINYSMADNYMKINEYQLSYAKLKKAINYKPDEHIYYDKMAQLAANISSFYFLNSKSADTAKFKKHGEFYLELATSSNVFSIKSSPKNVSYWKTKAKINYLFYQIKNEKLYLNESIKALKKSIEIAPTDPKLYYSLAVIYFDDLAKYDKAIKLINQSIELKPNYRDGYYLKALILKRIGKKDDAKKYLELILKMIDPNDEQVKKELTTL